MPDEVRRKFRVEEVPSFGNMIYLQDEPPPDETDADYVKTAADLYRTLQQHGIYRAPVAGQPPGQ